MKTIIELKLHKDEEVNSLILDFNDVYKFIGEIDKDDIEVAFYINKWCDYLNYRVYHNEEMCFGDTELARLDGWITGYNHAKKIDVKHFTGRVEIKMRKYSIILHRPYKSK